MNYKHSFIVLDKVAKSYGDDPSEYKSQALKSVSLTIQEGEYVIIFGPSGSGKSTLLNILAGLEMPSEGRILVRGRDLAHFDSVGLSRYHRLKTGMVFQNFNLLKSLNCWENVALPLTANGARYKFRKKRALYFMQLFSIEKYANKRPNEISGGEQQRLAIARSLINHPFLLLVDEPTGNLDTASADEVMAIFQRVHEKEKTTIVMVTHNPNHLIYATRVIHVQDGEVIMENHRELLDRMALALTEKPL